MHRIIRVYSLLAVLLDPIVHVFLENTVYGVYTVHRIIRVYSMLSKEKGPYGATMKYIRRNFEGIVVSFRSSQ